MASYNEAVAVRDAVLESLFRDFALRPRASGVMPLGEHGYAIKITLSGEPTFDLPGELNGVPIRYDFQAEPAVLVGERRMNWHQKARTRRR